MDHRGHHCSGEKIMSVGPRQPRPDTREKTKSQLNPTTLYSNTLCEVDGVYILPQQMTLNQLNEYMRLNGKEHISWNPDLSGHERGAKADRAGQTQTFHFGKSDEEVVSEIRRRMAEAMYRKW